MSLDQLKEFLSKVKDDCSLQEKLKAAKSSDDVVSIAKEHGHEFTSDKIDQLSDVELKNVTGGAFCMPDNIGYISSNGGGHFERDV